MKHKIYLLFLAMSSTLMAMAYNPINRTEIFPSHEQIKASTPDQISSLKQLKENQFGVMESEETKANHQNEFASRGSESNEVFTVRCNLLFDPLEYQLRYLCWYNSEDGGDEYWDYENYFIDIKAPAGTYDFMAIYRRSGSDSYMGVCEERYVILENVEVFADISLDFDPNTADHKIEFKPVMSTGEEAQILTYKLDDNWSYELLSKGNCAEIQLQKIITAENVGTVYSLSTNMGATITESPMGVWNPQEWVMDWYTTEVGERYTFTNVCFMLGYDEDEADELCTISTKGSKNSPVSNDPSKYYETTLLYDIDHSPIYNDSPLMVDYPYGVSFAVNSGAISMKIAGFERTTKYPIWGLKYSPFEDKGVKAEPIVTFYTVDYHGIDDSWGWNRDFYYKTSSSPIIFENGNYYNSLWIDNPGVKGNDYESMSGVPNPYLKYEYSSGLTIPGNNAPFCLLSAYDWQFEGWDPMLNIEKKYYGQTGEYREADTELATYEINTIDDNPQHLRFNFYDDNVAVDGIAGFNRLEGEFDLSKSKVIPALTGVQCRNTDGIVDMKYKDASDGQIYITAGGFEQDPISWNEFGQPIWDCIFSEPTLTIEYAPYSTSDFKELTEVELKEIAPSNTGAGAFYICSLEEVDQRSANGWYDARITLSTEEGNYVTQTISPLFYVDKLSGIETINSNTASENAVYYNLQGIRLPEAAKGLNIVCNADGTTSKVIIR